VRTLLADLERDRKYGVPATAGEEQGAVHDCATSLRERDPAYILPAFDST
jgi:hypothetical protein